MKRKFFLFLFISFGPHWYVIVNFTKVPQHGITIVTFRFVPPRLERAQSFWSVSLEHIPGGIVAVLYYYEEFFLPNWDPTFDSFDWFESVVFFVIIRDRDNRISMSEQTIWLITWAVASLVLRACRRWWWWCNDECNDGRMHRMADDDVWGRERRNSKTSKQHRRQQLNIVLITSYYRSNYHSSAILLTNLFIITAIRQRKKEQPKRQSGVDVSIRATSKKSSINSQYLHQRDTTIDLLINIGHNYLSSVFFRSIQCSTKTQFKLETTCTNSKNFTVVDYFT